MSEQRTALEDSPAMAKVFANAGIVDEPDTNDEAKTDGTDTQSGSSDTGTEQTDKVATDAGKDSLGGKDDSKPKPGKEEKGKVAGDPNDLTLPDGSVIKAGQERRWYEDGRIAKQQLSMSQNELKQVRDSHATLKTKYETLENTVKQIGLEDPTQVSAAVKLYKDLGRDLPGTLQKLLAEAKALGHTFEGVGGSIDTAAISHLIDTKLPKTSQTQPGPTKEEIDAQSTKDVTDFMAQFPDAATHEAHIAALIDRSVELGKPISLTDAYFMLKQRVVNDGLDWSKPIGPQIEARKQTQQPKTEQKPRTGGRAGVEANPVDPKDSIQPEHDMDADSIVLAAMKENGLNYSR